MYVDKKLGGVNAVQTLSRLNRTHPEKDGTMVLDFANEADAIKAAFEPYFETTLLSEATDPNLLYDSRTRLDEFPGLRPGRHRTLRQGLLQCRGDPRSALRVAAPGRGAVRGASRGRTSGNSAADLPTTCASMRSWRRCCPSPTPTWRSCTPSPATSGACCPWTTTNCPAKCSRTSTWSRTASRRPAPAASL